jgi:putative transposase
MLEPMPQSLAKVLIHVVFSTKERRPFLRDTVLRAELHCYIGGILNGFSQIAAVRSYIAGQEEHHRKHSFKFWTNQSH